MKNLMKNNSLILLLLVSFIMASCGGQSSSKETAEDNAPAEVNETVSTILTSYFALKDALVADDSERAQAAATAMLEVTANYAEILNGYIKIIEASEDIEAQRATFEFLSINIYGLAKTNNSGFTVYKQFCPMAFDDKGAFWLSSEKQILNPYFGASMLRCGRVEETIN